MFSTVLSATLQGLHVRFVQVEADVSDGLPMFQLVGYLSSEVKEAGERVRVAIRNSCFVLPAKRIVVNLSPANIRKRGTIFDLAIAVAVLSAKGEVVAKNLEDTILTGELSLDGSLKPVKGILPIVMEAQKKGYKKCIVPLENQSEGELVEGIQVVGVSNLQEVCKILQGDDTSFPITRKNKHYEMKEIKMKEDFADIKGQHLVKRAAEIAVAGNHNLLLVGSSGVGKTSIAKRLPGILPPLTMEESLELTMIYSIMGQLDQDNPLKVKRPFREVTSSVTQAALLGGGTIPRPGEISLAHKGVLFLDEIAEFPKSLLETLRQPLEEHRIRIIREKGEYEFPAEFLLVAAMNPCPCGNYPDLNKCTCTPGQVQAYMGKLSQPLLERIDLCVDVPKVQYEDLADTSMEESSETIRERIIKARKRQEERYQGLGILTNSQLNVRQIEEFCQIQEADKCIMKQAYERLELSARTYQKVLAVARTIADLEGTEEIEAKHLREALSYRTMEYRQGRN